MLSARIFAALSSVLFAAEAAAVETCRVRSTPRIIPLVELYTSEGCSSCPPADQWLSRQAKRQDANWLAFHVDYWDYIGWTDRFASPRYSARQRERVNLAGGNTVYTPQVMIGTDTRVAWQSERAFERVLESASGPAEVDLELALLDASPDLQARVKARSRTDAANPRLWLARYMDGQSSRVDAGENRGATLRHDRVVTDLWGPWPVNASGASIAQGISALAPDTGLVAFVEAANGHVLQSLELSARGCAAGARVEEK